MAAAPDGCRHLPTSKDRLKSSVTFPPAADLSVMLATAISPVQRFAMPSTVSAKRRLALHPEQGGGRSLWSSDILAAMALAAGRSQKAGADCALQGGFRNRRQGTSIAYGAAS